MRCHGAGRPARVRFRIRSGPPTPPLLSQDRNRIYARSQRRRGAQPTTATVSRRQSAGIRCRTFRLHRSFQANPAPQLQSSAASSAQSLDPGRRAGNRDLDDSRQRAAYERFNAKLGAGRTAARPAGGGARVREQFATMPVKRSHPGAKRDAEHKPRVALRAAGVASQSPMA